MSEPATPRQILLIAHSEPLARVVSDVLGRSHSVETVRSPLEARDWLLHRRADLAVMEMDMRELVLDKLPVLPWVEGGGPQLLGLIDHPADASLQALFERCALSNFLSVAGGRLDEVELAVTVAKLFGHNIFGWEQYLGAGATARELPVHTSADRESLIDFAQEFARDAGCHPRVAERVALAADELLTNALYDAPVDAHGKPRFASRARTMQVDLAPGEEIRFRLASDGRRLALAVEDPFGSLAPSTVRHYLAKGFARGEDQIDWKPGGAGLGLFSLFNLLHHFVLNIQPGRRTEALCLLELTRSYREFAAHSRSLNIFVAGR